MPTDQFLKVRAHLAALFDAGENIADKPTGDTGTVNFRWTQNFDHRVASLVSTPGVTRRLSGLAQWEAAPTTER